MINKFFEGLRPRKRLTVSQWSDQYRFLSSVTSAEPGRYRTDRMPYLREIMDCMSSHSTIETVVVMKGAQVGMTEAAFNVMGYTIQEAPAPIMYVMPTEDTVKFNSKNRFTPMVEASPSLRELVAQRTSRDTKNTTKEKQFPGGILSFAGANSPSSLRSKPVKILILDEIDEYPQDLAEQGSAIELALARTRTFSQRKVFMLSTPTTAESSQIEKEFLQTDQRYFYVPCPHCGEYQTLEIEGLKMVGETAQYFCKCCGSGIAERFKTKMLKEGEWRVTAKGKRKTRGYFISSLYSPYGHLSWTEILEKKAEAETNENKKKTFVNTILGLPYKAPTNEMSWETLHNRRVKYTEGVVPEGVAYLTAGVDVQADRLELELVGWEYGMLSYSLEYKVFLGDTGQEDVWQQLGDYIRSEFQSVDGTRKYKLSGVGVDSGYKTPMVYKFCNRMGSRVYAVKGTANLQTVHSAPKPMEVSPRGRKIRQRSRVWMVGSSYLKSELFGWLSGEKSEGAGYGEDGNKPYGYCEFPVSRGENYFKGLCSEEEIEERGKMVWRKTVKRNEPLDVRIYARAVMSICGAERAKEEVWAQRATYGERQVVKQKASKKEKRGGYWDN